MTKKSNVYTKSGDKGTTGLVGGSRVSKADERIHIYGEVDELNSHLGLAISMIEQSSLEEVRKEVSFLKGIQYYLFVIGSNFACEKENRDKFSIPKVSELEISTLENNLDRLDSQLEGLKYFVLPGGHVISSQFHICRTVCRRVERAATHYETHNVGELPEEILKYINRLSDYFFVLSRFVNMTSKNKEIYWIPGNPIS
ncbi:cob(I)yrinic acid a,c-diamide adenosyltransferase [Halobacteriovorax sp. HLS]|uniref:cob(I)yrinic acid a,c-diamide adenosyltransferase n=1 Tax=Halobacteriovorax sp. HLS TaxID=2234000 RepID=UPI000FD8E24B|nr:cob(I)yrinic acid a,c-diamide adenosyltransferase [Halobacteriovorax sp. HLS]